MTTSQRLCREGVLWQEVAGQVVVLDSHRSTYLAVNATGALLWPLLAEGCATDELAELLVERFGIDRDRALADVDRFVANLVERGLLESWSP